MNGCIDPFGAPEFLVDRIAFRSMVGTEYVRFGLASVEDSEVILRLKLILPVRHVLSEQYATRVFLRHRTPMALLS